MTAWLLIVPGLCLAVAGVLSAVASSAVRRVDLYRWASLHTPGAGAAASLLAAPRRVVRSAKALATIGMILTGMGVVRLVDDVPLGLRAALVAFLAVPAVLSVAYAAPRALARRWPDPIVRRVVPVLGRLRFLLSPVSRHVAEGRGVREFELEAEVADEATDRERLTALSGVVAFTERPVRDVMTPRTDIVAVPEGAGVEEVGRALVDSGYSRIPIYRDSLDNIVGMVYAFDVLKIAPGAELPIRPVMTVPGAKRCEALLVEMQRERRQVAAVLDEYGGTAGIVTFEDLLKELVGSVFGESTRARAERPSAIDLMEVTGTTPVTEVAAQFGVSFPEAADTVGGLLTRLAGRIPSTGERYLLGGLEFDVVSATPARLERLLVRRGPVPAVSLGSPEGMDGV